VTNTVQVSSVTSVRRAVEELYARTWPTGPVDKLGTAFGDFERPVQRPVSRFLGCDTGLSDYANIRSTTHLAMARPAGRLRAITRTRDRFGPSAR